MGKPPATGNFKGFVHENPGLRHYKRIPNSNGLTTKELFHKHKDEQGEWNPRFMNQGGLNIRNSFSDAQATAARRENLCYWKLLEAGGRPALLIGKLLALRDDYQDQEALRPWLDQHKLQDGDVPPVFSAQLADWEQFQSTWHWTDSGSTKPAVHLDATAAEPVKEEIGLGITGVASASAWDYLPASSEASHDAPREHDSFTIWTGYLNYLYWHLNQRASRLETAKSQYWREWDSFTRNVYPAQTAVSRPVKAADQLRLAAEQLEGIRRQGQRFLVAAEAYQVHLRDRERAELRFEWARNQLAVMQPSNDREMPTEQGVCEGARFKGQGDASRKARRPKLSIITS